MSQKGPMMDLLRLINGFQISQAIYVAATLGIADLLRDGARASDDLARTTNTQPRALYRLLRALAAVGVLHEHPGETFELTPTGCCLRSDVPNSCYAWACLVGRPHQWESWGNLLHTVKTGETAFDHRHGSGVWEWRSQKPEESRIFDAAMVSISRAAAAAVAAAYDFSAFGTLVDVGGGRGSLLAEILRRHIRLRGLLFDLPHVVAGSQSVLEAAGVADRCQVIGGDFFRTVPEGGDAYLLKSVLMDHDDTEAAAVLNACRRAMKLSTKLIVMERLLGEPNQTPEAKFSDLAMLVMTGGRERASDEFASLFGTCGLRLERVIPTQSPYSLVIAAVD
jgi:hypothetical protein